MFNLVRLLAEALPIEGAATNQVAVDLDRLINELRGREIKVPGRKAFRYPQSPALLEPIRAIFASPSSVVEDHHRTVALRELLIRPQRVFPGSQGDRFALTLVGGFQPDDVEDPFVVGLVLGDVDAGMVIDIEYGLADAAADILVAAFIRTDAASRTILPGEKKAPRLVWLGGSTGEGAPPDWRERIAAAAAVRGFKAVVFDQPYRRFQSVRKEVHESGAATALVWSACAGDSSGWISLPRQGGGDLRIIQSSELEFESALLDTMMQLDEMDAAASLPSSSTGGYEPATPGETRIYKKDFATPGHDVMVRTADCGHNAWQRARKAPKAEKGISKLENSASIAGLDKCMRCTGGGRWRATFAS